MPSGNCKTRETTKTGDETETNIRLRSERLGDEMGGIGILMSGGIESSQRITDSGFAQ